MMRIATALLAALLLAPVAAADGHERHADMARSAQGFTGISTAADGSDRFEIEYHAPTATLEHRYLADDGSLTLRHTVVALIEFEDLDGDGRYSLGDRTVHQTSLTSAPHTIQVSATGTGHQAEIVYTIVGPTQDGTLSEPEVATGTFHVVVDLQDDERRVPITLSTQDFPFREDGTSLAFDVRLSASQPLQRSAGDRPVVASTEALSTFYAWDETATVAGRPVPSQVTEVVDAPRDPTGTDVFYSFDGGDASQQTRIGTVPQALDIGVPLPRTAGDIALFAVGAVGMAAMVGVPTALRMRGRR